MPVFVGDNKGFNWTQTEKGEDQLWAAEEKD